MNGFKLTCESAEAPPTNVTWFREGVKLEIDGNELIQTQTVEDRFSSTYFTTLTVKLNNSSKLDDFNGVYTCSAGNSFGTTKAHAIVEGKH